MKVQINRLIDLSFIMIILFVIFFFIATLNLFFKNLPAALSVSILIIAVALTIIFLDKIELFMLFVGAIIVLFIFALTFNIEFTLTSSAIIIGLLVIFLVMIS